MKNHCLTNLVLFDITTDVFHTTLVCQRDLLKHTIVIYIHLEKKLKERLRNWHNYITCDKEDPKCKHGSKQILHIIYIYISRKWSERES